MPGVPDLYQGSELWQLALERSRQPRPVDYEPLRRRCETLDNLPPEEIAARMDEGLPKLWIDAHAPCG